MSRLAQCKACNFLKHGVKPRIMPPHTCGRDPKDYPKGPGDFKCTDCGGDAYIGLQPGKKPGSDWDGLLKPGERICLSCGRKRGIKIF